MLMKEQKRHKEEVNALQYQMSDEALQQVADQICGPIWNFDRLSPETIAMQVVLIFLVPTEF